MKRTICNDKGIFSDKRRKKMKFGTQLQFEYPEECPENCILKPDAFYQGCMCTRCPILVCKEPVTEEDKHYMPMVPANEFRNDWAEQWDEFFKTGKKPILLLGKLND